MRSHLFLCVLAYDVEWYMRAAWSDLIFTDPNFDKNSQHHQMSDPAMANKHSGENLHGTGVCQFKFT